MALTAVGGVVTVLDDVGAERVPATRARGAVDRGSVDRDRVAVTVTVTVTVTVRTSLTQVRA